MAEEKKKDNEELKDDNRSACKKVGDKFEDFFDDVSDVVYGENPDFQHDIPATMETPSGVRKVNKYQTRKNFNKRFIGKKGLIIIFIIIGVGLLISLGYYLINLLLLS